MADLSRTSSQGQTGNKTNVRNTHSELPTEIQLRRINVKEGQKTPGNC